MLNTSRLNTRNGRKTNELDVHWQDDLMWEKDEKNGAERKIRAWVVVKLIAGPEKKNRTGACHVIGNNKIKIVILLLQVQNKPFIF